MAMFGDRSVLNIMQYEHELMLDVCYGGHSFNTTIRTSLESSFVRSVVFLISTKDYMFS